MCKVEYKIGCPFMCPILKLDFHNSKAFDNEPGLPGIYHTFYFALNSQ